LAIKEDARIANPRELVNHNPICWLGWRFLILRCINRLRSIPACRQAGAILRLMIVANFF